MIMAGDPNEFGDTLAGLAGSLALLWIIVTAWHQSVELREQRRIIEEQKDEIAAQRIATQQMATALGTQARIYEDEMQARQEAKAKEEFRELLASLRTGFERAGEITWRVRSRRAADPEQVVDKAITLEAHVDRSKPIEDFLIDASFDLEALTNELFTAHEQHDSDDVYARPSRELRQVGYLTSVLDKLVRLYDRLSTSEQERYQRLRVSPMFFTYQKLIRSQVFAEDVT